MPSSRSAHPMPGPASHSLGLGSECEGVSKSCFTPFEFARGSCFETDAGGSQRETWNLGRPGPAHPRCRRGCGKLTCLHSGSRSDVFPGEQEQKGKQSHSGSLHSVPQTTRLPPTVSCRSHRRVWDRAPVSEMGGPGHLVPTTGLWSREEQALVASTLGLSWSLCPLSRTARVWCRGDPGSPVGVSPCKGLPPRGEHRIEERAPSAYTRCSHTQEPPSAVLETGQSVHSRPS